MIHEHPPCFVRKHTRTKQCLTSNLKIDPFGVGEDAVSLLAQADEARARVVLR